MKDSGGHGSSGRGGFKSGRPTGSGLPFGVRQGFQTKSGMKPDNDRTNNDANRTVADLRSRMSGTGPGHQSALWQGIKNLVGG
jgi:hypothetical protein